MEGLLYSFLAGSSTVIGAFLVLLFGKIGKKTMAAVLGFAGGIMIALSLFELMPESLDFGNTGAAIIGFIGGCAMMYALDIFVPHAHMSTVDQPVIENPDKIGLTDNKMLRTGYLVFFGIALHNVPEGLAIGAGLESSPQLGLAIAIAIALHNIPEGLAVAGPLKAGGISTVKVILFTLGAGLMTVVGTAIALLVVRISPVFVGGALAFAAGAMVYIVIDELIPQANALHAHLANAALILGIVIGFLIF